MNRLSDKDTRMIAKICHEANRAYCQTANDDSQVPWEDAPQWQRDSAIMGVTLHANNPDAGPQASHDSWMRQKIKDGWVWGEKKDPQKKEHHCLVSFEDLPKEQQVKDFLFRGTVHSVIEGLQL